MARIVVLRLNRYGSTFAANKSPSTYKPSGRKFASYYPFACTRCGNPFACPTWQRHTLSECDMIIREEERGVYRAIGIPDLKRHHLRGIKG